MNVLNCVIVFIFCFGVTKKGQALFVSQNKTTWDESTCSLVEPDIICRDDGSCIVENGLEFLTNAEEEDNGFWIGFSKTWISYAYVGCNQLHAGSEYSVSTLGECRRKTGCQTFGIRNSTTGLKCKCASTSKVHWGACSRMCEDADEYPCGDTSNTTMFSIYTVGNVPPSSHSANTDNNCLLFYYRFGNDFLWQPCNLNTTPALLCSDKDFSNQNQTAQKSFSSNQKWAIAVGHCFDRKEYPATIQSIQNAQFTEQNSQDHWTGILKQESIISMTYMLDHITNPPVTFAYVEQIEQTFHVRFANEGDSKRSLCAGDNDKFRSSEGLATGLSVSLVLLIALAISVVLLLMKRRRLLTKCYKQNGEKSNQNEDTATEISFISTPKFEPSTNKMNELTVTNQSYFVLETTLNGETIEDTDHYAELDTTDVNHYELTKTSQKDTDDDYDTTEGKHGSAKSGLAKPNNNYNKVSLHQTNEYDHINHNELPPKSDRQTENEYDLSNNVIDGKRNISFRDDIDTYNRLNIHGLENSGTDNVYRKSEADGESEYDTSNALYLSKNIAAKDQ